LKFDFTVQQLISKSSLASGSHSEIRFELIFLLLIGYPEVKFAFLTQRDRTGVINFALIILNITFEIQKFKV
jgi:hypothetical protein